MKRCGDLINAHSRDRHIYDLSHSFNPHRVKVVKEESNVGRQGRVRTTGTKMLRSDQNQFSTWWEKTFRFPVWPVENVLLQQCQNKHVKSVFSYTSSSFSDVMNVHRSNLRPRHVTWFGDHIVSLTPCCVSGHVSVVLTSNLWPLTSPDSPLKFETWDEWHNCAVTSTQTCVLVSTMSFCLRAWCYFVHSLVYSCFRNQKYLVLLVPGTSCCPLFVFPPWSKVLERL